MDAKMNEDKNWKRSEADNLKTSNQLYKMELTFFISQIH